MTGVEYEHWCDFAIRMALRCYGDHKRPSGTEIYEWVMEYLERWASDYVHVTDWDRGTAGYCVCDDFDSWANDYEPGFYWRILDELDEDGTRDHFECQDLAQERDRLAHEQWQEQWMGPVRCCIRAGLDMATRIGGGVVGFSVADLRAMFPGRIPDYVNRHYEEDLNEAQPDAHVWL